MSIDLRNWSEQEQELYSRLLYMDGYLFAEYVPAREEPAFDSRLQDWLNSTGDEVDRRKLFGLLEYLYFIGERELDILYRKAFRADVMWWLTPPDVRLDDEEGFSQALADALEETWFCPLTDSMNIAHFHHVNGIRDRDLRPEWRALAKLGDAARVSDYLGDHGYQRLVLLEDFVGTGNQARSTIEWTLEQFPELPVLVCPLVICQQGVDAIADIIEPHERCSLRPGIIVPVDCTLGPPPSNDEPAAFAELRELLLRLISLVDAPGNTDDEKAFGYGCIGALTVLFTNCPNNAPAALHHADSSTWKPLFPRAIRS
jgi:hypothetical protein